MVILSVSYTKGEDKNLVGFDGEYRRKPFEAEYSIEDKVYNFTYITHIDDDDCDDIMYLLDKYLTGTEEFKQEPEYGEFGIAESGDTLIIM